jgi:hypothetical protein
MLPLEFASSISFRCFSRGCELFQSWFLVEKELESLPRDEEGRIARNIFHMSDTKVYEKHYPNHERKYHVS